MDLSVYLSDFASDLFQLFDKNIKNKKVIYYNAKLIFEGAMGKTARKNT